MDKKYYEEKQSKLHQRFARKKDEFINESMAQAQKYSLEFKDLRTEINEINEILKEKEEKVLTKKK